MARWQAHCRVVIESLDIQELNVNRLSADNERVKERPKTPGTEDVSPVWDLGNFQVS
jgi:hypothetical protein